MNDAESPKTIPAAEPNPAADAPRVFRGRRRAALVAAMAAYVFWLSLNLAISWLNTELDRQLPRQWAGPAVAFMSGLVFGEIAALSTLMVWANGHVLLRLMVLWFAGLIAFASIHLGAELTALNVVRGTMREDLTALPLISLALQLPQWWMRIYLHWRLAVGDHAEQRNRRNSLSIQDILIGTAVVATTFAIVRFSAGSREIDLKFWSIWLVVIAGLAAIGQLVLMPLVVLVLRLRTSIPALAFLLIAPLAGPLVLSVLIAMKVTTPPAGAFLSTYGLGFASLLSASVPLWILRFAGYRLVMGKTAPHKPQEVLPL